MDVSNSEELGGEKLVEAIVSLTGLPAQEAHDELDRILQMTGQTSASELTLDGLRAAMLAYLESLDAGITNAQNADAGFGEQQGP